MSIIANVTILINANFGSKYPYNFGPCVCVLLKVRMLPPHSKNCSIENSKTLKDVSVLSIILSIHASFKTCVAKTAYSICNAMYIPSVKMALQCIQCILYLKCNVYSICNAMYTMYIPYVM